MDGNHAALEAGPTEEQEGETQTPQAAPTEQTGWRLPMRLRLGLESRREPSPAALQTPSPGSRSGAPRPPGERAVQPCRPRGAPPLRMWLWQGCLCCLGSSTPRYRVQGLGSTASPAPPFLISRLGPPSSPAGPDRLQGLTDSQREAQACTCPRASDRVWLCPQLNLILTCNSHNLRVPWEGLGGR